MSLKRGRHADQMRFAVTTIPHAQQRYPTCGDWLAYGHRLSHIRVSNVGNDDYHFLIALHELIEAHLCLKRGISQADVDRFDKAYERKRREGDDSEPGDDPKAPYRREHQFATSIERQVADELGVDWDTYDAAIGALV